MGFWSNTILPTGHGIILIPHYNPTVSDYPHSTTSYSSGAWSPYSYDSSEPNEQGEKNMAALKENAIKVFNYVKEHEAEGVTAKDIAKALSLDPRSVNGIVTSAFQRKGLMVRVEDEITNADGTHDKVKFVKLTDAGKEFDPYAKAEDAE